MTGAIRPAMTLNPLGASAVKMPTTSATGGHQIAASHRLPATAAPAALGGGRREISISSTGKNFPVPSENPIHGRKTVGAARPPILDFNPDNEPAKSTASAMDMGVHANSATNKYQLDWN